VKIVVVHSRYRSVAPSGENRVVDQEGEALAALGHEVTRFERRSDDIEGWSKARKAALPAKVVWNGAARRELRAVLREHRPDVVHLHNTFPLLSASVLYACQDESVPVVATIHNYKLACASGDFFRDGSVCHDCSGGLPGPALRHGCYRGSLPATAPVALAMTAHRQAWRRLVSAYAFISAAQRDLLGGVGLPRERMFVRHNLIPARVAQGRRPAPGGAERQPVVMYAGRLDAAKGLPVLMAGWDRYLAIAASRGGAGRTPGLSLLIAGSGPLEPAVTEWAATRPSVRLAGQLDPAACAQAMASARAVILPSAWEETFGLAAVEAMALGVPPVAAGHGSFPELITDGVDGVLFRPRDADALASAISDADQYPERYAECGDRARKTYEQRFDPADSMQRLLDIYQYAIEHPALLPSGGYWGRGARVTAMTGNPMGHGHRRQSRPPAMPPRAGAPHIGLRPWAKAHPWRLTLIIMFVIAATVIGSNGISDFASSLVHGNQAEQALSAPHFNVAAPPKPVCGNPAALSGPSSPPAGAQTVPAGENSVTDLQRGDTAYWFAPGVHTFGSGRFTQIIAGHGSTYIGAPGAVLDGRHLNQYAFGGYNSRVTIAFLTIRNFGGWGENQDQGVVNHNSASGWTIEHSTLADNAGAGTMLGSGNVLSYSCLKDNQQYGFNAYAKSGISNLVIEHNEIVGNDSYNWEEHFNGQGCGCTGGGKFWNVNGATVVANYVHDNHSVGLWADTNNRSFDVRGNYISGNYSDGMIYEISYNARIVGNTFVRNAIGQGPKNPGFPTSALYISESGGDSRVPGKFSGTLEISQNTFLNNWSGVILWENSNRFCNSPANTSSGFCTLVNPSKITLNGCNEQNIANPPYYDDCRWKTQNVSVDHNVFDFSPSAVSGNCSAAVACGFQGVFSEFGSYPSWSPYQGTTVEQAITLHQGNRFFANVYNGPWQFMGTQQGNVISWQSWRAGPYRQDGGSSLYMSTP
jgi:glycosyltransferase involved in cell wall biosynthesis